MSKVKLSEKNMTTEIDSKKSRSKGKTPKEVMKKHILDKNDVITEEDFKNLDLDFEPGVTEEPLQISNNKNRPKDEDKDPKEITPWDVIKE